MDRFAKIGKQIKNNFFFLLLFGLGISHLISALSGSFVFDGKRYFTLVDDAMISMRYARNLALDNAIQLNLGDVQNPQGYSNTLWTFIMSLIHSLGIPEQHTSLAIIFIGSLLNITFVFVIYLITKNLTIKKWSPLISAFLCATFFPIFYWSTRGMEFSLQILLAYLLIGLTLCKKNKATIKYFIKHKVLSILLVFTRIDSLIIVLICSVYSILNLKSKSASYFSKKIYSIGFAITPLLSGFFALSYNKLVHNDFLPTTYYLKVTGVSLFERLMIGFQAFISNGFQPFVFTSLAIFLMGIFYSFKYKIDRRLILLITIFLAQLIYSIYTGGDYAEPQVLTANRFFSLGFPSAFILLAVLGDQFNLKHLLNSYQGSNTLAAKIYKTHINIIVMISLLLLTCALNFIPWLRVLYERRLPMVKSDIQRARKGLLIEKNFNSNCRLASHAAGNVFYFSDGFYAIDLLGKSDNIIAKGMPATSFRPGHNKWNYDYSIKTLKADIVADQWGKFPQWAKKNGWTKKFLGEKGEFVYIRKGDNSCFINQELLP